MARIRHPEWRAGFAASKTYWPLLSESWPAAFPLDMAFQRPLAPTIVDVVAKTIDRSEKFSYGVIARWKRRPEYCAAVLKHDDLIGIDGCSTGFAVCAQERLDAAGRLDRLTTAPTPSPLSEEFMRGMKAAATAFTLLREHWPLAFPADGRQVQPLAGSLATRNAIMAQLDWSQPYADGVLLAWKQRVAYCNAVLRCDERIDLAGIKTGKLVTEDARKMARGQLAAITERRERRAKTAAQTYTAPVAIKQVEPAPVAPKRRILSLPSRPSPEPARQTF
jgi:sRNA-binding protein